MIYFKAIFLTGLILCLICHLSKDIITTKNNYKLLYRSISVLHYVLLTVNIISVPLLVIFQPIYIWCPLLTVLFSPLVSQNCIMNNLVARYKALAEKD